MRTRLLGLVLLAAATVACSGDSPSAPSPASVQGTWAGTFTSSSFTGTGTAQATIAQSGTNITGTWFADDPTGPGSGTLTGSVSASSVSITLQPSNPLYCPMSLTLTVNGTQMSGTVATVSCSTFASGSITLTKQ